MPDTWNDLMSCLELRSMPETGDAASRLVFEATNQRLPHRRLFGGQLLAQFVAAATAAHPGKSVKSLHALFVREGASDTPVHYAVDCRHEGRSFGALTLTARQGDRLIATCSVSSHLGEDGPAHDGPRPPVRLPGPEHRVEFALLPWDTRSVTDLDDPAAGEPEYDLWMRIPETGAAVGAALLAYSTDLNVIGTALRPFAGIDQRGNGTAFTSATTSHTVWFHRPFDTGDWLLLRHYGTVVAHGRCFGRGEVLTADGTPVASFAQEALLRFHPVPGT